MGRKVIRIGNCINGCNSPILSRGMCKSCYRKVHYVEHERNRRYPDGVSKERECKVGTKIEKDGYINIKVPKGYSTSNRDWVKEHRYIMEQHLGRRLKEFENVHHKNGNRKDNNLSNLELWITKQPKGQRPKDLIEYAEWILKTYKNKENDT